MFFGGNCCVLWCTCLLNRSFGFLFQVSFAEPLYCDEPPPALRSRIEEDGDDGSVLNSISALSEREASCQQT